MQWFTRSHSLRRSNTRKCSITVFRGFLSMDTSINSMAAAEWEDDSQLFELMRSSLYTPVVGDILDALGRYHQFLPQPVQPLREEMIVAGRAMPVLMIDVHGPQKKPFGLLTEAL